MIRGNISFYTEHRLTQFRFAALFTVLEVDSVVPVFSIDMEFEVMHISYNVLIGVYWRVFLRLAFRQARAIESRSV